MDQRASAVLPLELLAPARNLECGIAAVDHGADAVYIGAERFGARAAAGNSVEDIAQLCNYAHQFGAKVYVTVNTLLHDEEMAEAVSLIHDIYKVGADAVLIQDLRLLNESLPPIEIHASTQTDNRTAAKVCEMHALGMKRVVLARELSMEEMKAVHKSCPDVELEAFVHGALCVSYSGRCHASERLTGRSANRGECAQICRLRYRLVDESDNDILPSAHYLSLKDLCRIECLQEMADAGITSFKIEGRLKDVGYVKNVVAAYSRALDKVVKESGGRYARASRGKVELLFEPNVEKSFNRSFTDYFTDGRKTAMAAIHTPKSIGQRVGKVKDIYRDYFTVASVESFANGDGLCYFTQDSDGGRTLCGIRINRAVGNKLYPLSMPRDLKKGTVIFRNNDALFQELLAKKSSTRYIPVDMELDSPIDGVLRLCASNNDGIIYQAEIDTPPLEEAKTPQLEIIVGTLSKLGGTIYRAGKVGIAQELQNKFIPRSILAELRRKTFSQDIYTPLQKQPQEYEATLCGNLSHSENNGLPHNENRGGETILMYCRYCIRHEVGMCLKQGGDSKKLSLIAPDGRHLNLQFDCRNCEMYVTLPR